MDQAFPRIEPALSEIATERGGLRVAEIRLGGTPRGAALVFCDAGRFDADAAGVMNLLAEHGYESVAADLPRSAARAPHDEWSHTIAALLAFLGMRGWEAEQVGVVGYGIGAWAALLAAAEVSLGAAVSAGLTAGAEPSGESWDAVVNGYRSLRTPWLGMVGEHDADAAEALFRRLDTTVCGKSSVYTELVRYPGVGAEFIHDPAETLAHAAAFDSRQRTTEWFNLRVVPRLTPLAEAWQARQAECPV